MTEEDSHALEVPRTPYTWEPKNRLLGGGMTNGKLNK